MAAERSAESKWSPVTTRRAFVGGVGAVVLGCSSDDAAISAEPAAGTGAPENTDPTAAGAPENTDLTGTPSPGGTPAASTPGSCTLYPEQTEGPYYVAGDLVRSDLREGKPGTPLTLDLLVLSSDGCTPLANAAVDIWHCDAGGIYSGYQNQLGGLDTRGEVFLRGTQLTGSDGRARFQTIYPGWYPGRTTHVHFKVHLSGNREATSQLYFAEELNREVYGTAPYATHGQKDTANSADLFGRGAPLLAVTRSGQSYTASMTITVAS
jgi:protocatechuate 3,4-dioxygenase beta subunit